LIDRMGSVVLGFDGASMGGGSELENEVKRVVQTIEQYPETGKRVFELVLGELEKFLEKFLKERGISAKQLVSVAQQVEQREALAIQYTIEMRNQLQDVPVAEEVRDFLLKTWCEVLALASIRYGAQDLKALDLKKVATDLVWSASPKPNRQDRARVITDLPHLLQRLRGGMALLGMSNEKQDEVLQLIKDALTQAFMSKADAIDRAAIDKLGQKLANLEEFFDDDDVGDLPLDESDIELMLGIDTSNITVITDGGSRPSPAMMQWAKELQLGAWFQVDHNGKTSRMQYSWRSEKGHLSLFASESGMLFLMQAKRVGAYLQAGLMLPMEEESLTVRATREALTKLDANPERLFQ
jgi:hypothetical protein